MIDYILKIKIERDNYAYIYTDNDYLYRLIQKSFTRTVRKYNNYWKVYQDKSIKHYTLVNDGKVIKVKAGLIEFLCRSFKNRDIDYELEDNRNKANIKEYEIIYQLNDDIELRDYQYEAVKNVFKRNYCCVQLPTGSGKTEVASSIIKTYLSKYSNRAALYVVPTIRLQTESKERFEKYGIEVNINQPFKTGAVNIVTYTGLVRSKIECKERNKVGLLVYDEMQHLKADKSSKITHEFKKLDMCVGLSATITADIQYKKFLNKLIDDDFNVFGCTGYPAYYKLVKETIDEEFITPVEVHVVENKEKVKLPYGEASDWHTIRREVLMSDNRAQLIAEYTKYLIDENGFNTMCLLIPEVNWSQKFMLKLAEVFKDSNSQRLILTYGSDRYDEIIDGKIVQLSRKDKVKALEDIKNPDIRTIFSATSYMYEGIDITNMQALINVYGGRSNTRVKQQLGRATRLFKDKDIAYIYEIYDDNPVLRSQLHHRLKIYISEYDAKIIRDDFKLGQD